MGFIKTNQFLRGLLVGVAGLISAAVVSQISLMAGGLVFLVAVIAAIFLFIRSLRRDGVISKILSWIAILLIAINLFISFVGRPRAISGDSLKPYLTDGQIFMSAHIYSPIGRGDIITLNGAGNMTAMVFGLPGEKLKAENGIVYINSRPINSIQYSIGNSYGYAGASTSIAAEITIPDGQYFYMPTYDPGTVGENPAGFELQSQLVKGDDIIGRYWFKL